MSQFESKEVNLNQFSHLFHCQIVSKVLLFFMLLAVQQVTAQEHLQRCKDDGHIYKSFKQLAQRADYYGQRIMKSRELSDLKQELCPCYFTYIKKLEDKVRLGNFWKSKPGRRESNIRKLDRKTDLNEENRRFIIRHCRDCFGCFPEEDSVSRIERIRTRRDLELDRIKRELDDTEIHADGPNLLIRRNLMGFQKDKFATGEYRLPLLVIENLENLVRSLQTKADEQNLPQSGITYHAYGFADALPINNEKFDGLNLITEDAIQIGEYTSLASIDDPVGMTRLGVSLVKDEEFGSNENLALARAMETVIIMRKYLPRANERLFSVPFPNETGGKFRAACVIIKVENYFKEILAELSGEELDGLKKIDEGNFRYKRMFERITGNLN